MFITPFMVFSSSPNFKVSGHRDWLILLPVAFAYDLDFCRPITSNSAPESMHAPSSLSVRYISFPCLNFFNFKAYTCLIRCPCRMSDDVSVFKDLVVALSS